MLSTLSQCPSGLRHQPWPSVNDRGPWPCMPQAGIKGTYASGPSRSGVAASPPSSLDSARTMMRVTVGESGVGLTTLLVPTPARVRLHPMAFAGGLGTQESACNTSTGTLLTIWGLRKAAVSGGDFVRAESRTTPEQKDAEWNHYSTDQHGLSEAQTTDRTASQYPPQPQVQATDARHGDDG
jgi:hypothetical protein